MLGAVPHPPSFPNKIFFHDSNINIPQITGIENEEDKKGGLSAVPAVPALPAMETPEVII